MPSRIVIVGTSGSGKTTLAKRIAAQKGIPHIELDVLYWQPGWVGTPEPEFHNKIKHAVSATENWIVCGNYNAAKKITLPAATDIIWLNYPLYKNLHRGFKRSLQRILFQKEVFAGCLESFRLTFFSKKSILLWIWQTHKGRRAEFAGLLTKESFPTAKIYVIKTEADYNRLLKEI